MVDSPLYQAADEVLNYLSGLVDENNEPVFASSGYGIWLPSDLPSDSSAGNMTPALRVWISNPGYNVTTEQMFTGERDATISIGIYHWLPTHNLLSGTDGVVAADGVTFSSASGGISDDPNIKPGFFGFDGYMVAVNDTSIGYIDTVVSNNEVVLDTRMTPGTGLNWWLRQSEVNPGRVMVNYADYVLRWLQRKDVSGDGFVWTAKLWSPKSTQIIRPDLFGQLRKYNGNVPIQPPWFAVEIPLGADIWDVPIA
jgi:hypothetical protein